MKTPTKTKKTNGMMKKMKMTGTKSTWPPLPTRALGHGPFPVANCEISSSSAVKRAIGWWILSGDMARWFWRQLSSFRRNWRFWLWWGSHLYTYA